MARAAYQLALESPHITAEVVEISEFPELAQRYNVRSVPLTIIGDRLTIPGAMPEATLVEQVLKAAEGGALEERPQEMGPTTTTTTTTTPETPGQGSGSGIIVP